MEFHSLDPVAPNFVYKLTAVACNGFSVWDVWVQTHIFLENKYTLYI